VCDLCPRDRGGDACVVDGALRLQPRHRGIDLRLVVFAPSQPLTHLGFRQLTSREHLQCIDVSGRHASRLQ
jgi:hypothetical protein